MHPASLRPVSLHPVESFSLGRAGRRVRAILQKCGRSVGSAREPSTRESSAREPSARELSARHSGPNVRTGRFPGDGWVVRGWRVATAGTGRGGAAARWTVGNSKRLRRRDLSF